MKESKWALKLSNQNAIPQLEDETRKPEFEKIKSIFRNIMKNRESQLPNIKSSLSYDLNMSRKNKNKNYKFNKLLALDPILQFNYIKQTPRNNNTKIYKRLNIQQHLEQNLKKLKVFYGPLKTKMGLRFNSQISPLFKEEIKSLNNTQIATSLVSQSEIFERKDNFPKFYPFFRRKIVKMTKEKFKKMIDKILKTTRHQVSHSKYFSDLF